jgi:hypothetical protein
VETVDGEETTKVDSRSLPELAAEMEAAGSVAPPAPRSDIRALIGKKAAAPTLRLGVAVAPVVVMGGPAKPARPSKPPLPARASQMPPATPSSQFTPANVETIDNACLLEDAIPAPVAAPAATPDLDDEELPFSPNLVVRSAARAKTCALFVAYAATSFARWLRTVVPTLPSRAGRRLRDDWSRASNAVRPNR